MVKKRDAVLQVYVTPDEKLRVERAAAVVGLSAAAYIRQVILAEVLKHAELAK